MLKDLKKNPRGATLLFKSCNDDQKEKLLEIANEYQKEELLKLSRNAADEKENKDLKQHKIQIYL